MPIPGLLRSLLRRASKDGGTTREVEKTDAQWCEQLTAEQYRILRLGGTERPGTGPHLGRATSGAYACVGCGAVLFEAAAKFDSRTGWPSFSAATDAVETKRDLTLLIPRTEVRCRRCGGHLGHIFGDGPRPTGQRYCINGAALRHEDEPTPG